ncbi:MAG TPA: hypothetical protein VK923_15045 [Euzebyales bacterium]|nr:hypothetical protein [Euzebyales bacterium]
MGIPRTLTLVLVIAVTGLACSTAERAAPAPTALATTTTADATDRQTPSTSSAQVTIETPDVGITTVRALARAIATDDRDAAWALLGPRTRAAIGSHDGLADLDALLTPLTTEDTPFDDVIVAQTPDSATHLVVLGDAETQEPIAVEVVRCGDDATVELSPPVPSQMRISVARRRQITIITPKARDVELVVDGFHFHPTVADDGRSAVMHIPYPLSERNHVLGAWYRGDGDRGVTATVIDTSRDG